MTRKLITKMEPLGPVFKGRTMMGRAFIQRVKLTCHDGTTVESHEAEARKKDLPGKLARVQEEIDAKGLTAEFQNGEFWTTSCQRIIGAGGFKVIPADPTKLDPPLPAQEGEETETQPESQTL